MKLNKRLQAIFDEVTEQYKVIWDGCCDHGYLGFALLKHKKQVRVHFVDQVSDIMEKLRQDLKQYRHHLDPSNQAFVHTMDVADIDLSLSGETPPNTAPQLVIIAGVGGDLLLQLIEKITLKNKHLTLHFLICPVHHTFYLRDGLRKLNMALINEKIVVENKRYYEILLCCHQPNNCLGELNDEGATHVSLIGDKMWQPFGKLQQDYLKVLLTHYKKSSSRPAVQTAKKRITQQALGHYQQLLHEPQQAINKESKIMKPVLPNMALLKSACHESLNKQQIEDNTITMFTRLAARAIVLRGNKLLMLYTQRYHDYTLPGGGVDEHETIEAGLVRELIEETGAKQVSINSEFGLYEEFRPHKSTKFNSDCEVMHMLSFCYVCEIAETLGETQFESHEISNGMEVLWIDIDEALAHNYDTIKHSEKKGMSIERETFLLEQIKAKLIVK